MRSSEWWNRTLYIWRNLHYVRDLYSSKYVARIDARGYDPISHFELWRPMSFWITLFIHCIAHKLYTYTYLPKHKLHWNSNVKIHNYTTYVWKQSWYTRQNSCILTLSNVRIISMFAIETWACLAVSKFTMCEGWTVNVTEPNKWFESKSRTIEKFCRRKYFSYEHIRHTLGNAILKKNATIFTMCCCDVCAQFQFERNTNVHPANVLRRFHMPYSVPQNFTDATDIKWNQNENLNINWML